MKRQSLLLNSVATWLLFADPAQAEPVSLAIAAIAKGGIAAALFKGALAIGAQVGMSLYQRAKAKKAQKAQQPRGVNVSVRTGDDNPAEFPIGKSSTPGIRSYAGSWGQADKTPNAFFTDVLEISLLPVPGLAGMWAGEKKCTVLWNEPHQDGRGCPVQEFRSGNTDYMWVKFVDGSQTVADPFLRATFGNHPTRPYKETMIGRGVAYVAVTTRFNTDLFPNGKPEYLFEPAPPVFYDIRKDSTAGGNGPHRWGDRSTWEPTENNAVIIYNIIRGIYYGTEWVFGGRNLSPFRLPASNWMAAANECDRLIALQMGGTEKQFRCGMQVYADMQPDDLVKELLSLAIRMAAASESYIENLGVYRTVTKKRGNGNWFWRASDDGLSGGPNLANVMELRDSGHFFVPGIYAQTTAAAANVSIDANGTLLRSTSSEKYKWEIEDLNSMHRDMIFAMRPVWYRSTCENDNALWSWYGLIAEEVGQIDPRLVHWKTKTSRLEVRKKLIDVEVPYIDENGEPAIRIEKQEVVDKIETIEEPLPQPIAEGVMYERIIPHLIAIAKIQRDQIVNLTSRIAALEAPAQ